MIGIDSEQNSSVAYANLQMPISGYTTSES